MSIPFQSDPERMGNSGSSDADGRDVSSRSPQSGIVRAVMHGDLSRLAGKPRSIILYVVLLIGGSIDLVTFYPVLARVLPELAEELVWTGVVGFTVTVLTLAHMAGTRMRHRASQRQPPLSSTGAWVCLGSWLVVGVIAFTIRMIAPDTNKSTFTVDGQVASGAETGTSEQFGTVFLAALLFLGLYLATGAIATLSGFMRHDPDTRQHSFARGVRSRGAREVSGSAENLEKAQGMLDAIRQCRSRVDEAFQRSDDECEAAAQRLKAQVRICLTPSSIDSPGSFSVWPDSEEGQ